MTCFWFSTTSVRIGFQVKSIPRILLIGSFRIVVLKTVPFLLFPLPFNSTPIRQTIPLKTAEIGEQSGQVYYWFCQKVSILRHRFLTIVKINLTVI